MIGHGDSSGWVLDSYADTTPKGDVVGITVIGQPTLILGSAKAANDLLDARGEHLLFSRALMSAVAYKGKDHPDYPDLDRRRDIL